jgi:hypothetical protein
MRKYRIQFWKQTDRDLKHLTKALGVNPKAEFIPKTVDLLRLALWERRGEGRIVIESHRDKTKKELLPI